MGLPRINRIGVVVDGAAKIGRELVRGIEAYAIARPRWRFVYVGRPHERPNELQRVESCDGVISQPISPAHVRRLKASKAKFVIVGSAQPGKALPVVMTDANAIGELAAEHLIGTGVRHFAFWPSYHGEFSRRRCMAFARALQVRGFELPQPHICPRDQRPQALRRQLVWLRALPKPIGVLAGNDAAACELMSLCEQAKLSIPDELAVLGVDNDDLLAALVHPPLSSIDHGAARVGYEAARLLDQLLHRQKPTDSPRLVKPVGVVTRGSTMRTSGDARIDAAVHFIQHAITEHPISVDDVADAMALSRRRAEILFRDVLRRSIHQHIVREQTELAKRLLASTDLKIQSIARRCGFNYAPHMARVFRAATGQSPTDYRRSVRFDDLK